MSRGGSRGGRGGGRGRGGFGGGSTAPPMGLTFADIQNLSREATALYPPKHQPTFIEPSEDEWRIAKLQQGISLRLRNSKYYIVERTRSTELPRYSDKYRPSANTQPVLKRKDLHAPFFPETLLEEYFNPKGKSKAVETAKKSKINLDDILDGGGDEEKSSDERSDAGSAPDEDYDVDEEYDNDYAEDYFDNGEGDDGDDLGGGGGDDGGGGMEYD